MNDTDMFNTYSGGRYATMPQETQTADPYDPNENLNAAIQAIEDAVRGENEDRLFYANLIREASSAEDKRIITGIMEDEMKHYGMFRQLYYALTGYALPEYPASDVARPASYCEGLKGALLGEQNAVRNYRTILFAMRHRKYINMMAEIITDELRHLGLYNYLYAKNSCNS